MKYKYFHHKEINAVGGPDEGTVRDWIEPSDPIILQHCRLLSAIFGESLFAFGDKPYWNTTNRAGESITQAIDKALKTLKPREERVLEFRFPVDGAGGRTLSSASEAFGVTRERIRQIEIRALIKLRHPTRSLPLREFQRQYLRSDMHAIIAREDLYIHMMTKVDISLDTVRRNLAYQVAMRTQRWNLAATLRASEKADLSEVSKLLSLGCIREIELTSCPLCEAPAIPPSEWCLQHLGEKSRVTLKCDGCGELFTRYPGALLSTFRTAERKGKEKKGLFCTRKCYYANAARLGFYANRPSSVAKRKRDGQSLRDSIMKQAADAANALRGTAER